MIALVAAAALSLAVIPLARAGFASSARAAGGSVGSASLSAPSGLSASCSGTVASLRWTATASAFADGYEILRATTSGGPYTSVASVTGQGTTSFNDSSVVKKHAYYYVVRATKQLWRSGSSNEATASC
jgi:hypothetical protein